MSETKTDVIYPTESHLRGFYDALSIVAKERIYIEMIEAPPFEKVAEFQRQLMARNGPVYYAVNADRVVGWCDVFPLENPRQSHRGNLGMGLIPEYRGQGLGRKLLGAVLKRAKEFGLEKVELEVYTSNTPAIRLYENLGFEREGLIKRYRKLDGHYFDCLAMGKFLL